MFLLPCPQWLLVTLAGFSSSVECWGSQGKVPRPPAISLHISGSHTLATSESPEGLLIHRLQDPIQGVWFSGVRVGPRICISVKFPGGNEVADPGTATL